MVKIPKMDDLKTNIVQSLGTGIASPISAILGHPVTRQVLVVDTDRQNLVWVHGLGDNPDGVKQVVNTLPTDQLMYGLPVKIQVIDQQYFIMSINPESAGEFFSDAIINTQTMNNVDQFAYGILIPFEGGIVRALGALWDDGSPPTRLPTQNTADFFNSPDDTSANPIDVPTNLGRSIAVLIQADDTGALSYKQGTEFNAVLTHEQAYDGGFYPSVDADRFRYGWVRLTSGMTEIKRANIYTRPPIYTSGGGSSTDELVAVSDNDTTPDYLLGKLVAGTNITLTEQNDGGDESILIASTASGSDELVGVSATDTTPDYLTDKLTVDTDTLTKTINNPSGDANIELGSLAKSRVSSNDTTPDYLLGKFTAGTGISISEQNDGGDESLQVTNTITELDDLSDVVLSSPSTNQVLEYNGTNWINATPSGGGGGGMHEWLFDFEINISDGTATIDISGESYDNYFIKMIVLPNDSTTSSEDYSIRFNSASDAKYYGMGLDFTYYLNQNGAYTAIGGTSLVVGRLYGGAVSYEFPSLVDIELFNLQSFDTGAFNYPMFRSRYTRGGISALGELWGYYDSSLASPSLTSPVDDIDIISSNGTFLNEIRGSVYGVTFNDDLNQ